MLTPAAKVNGDVWAADFADDKVVHFPKPNKDSRCKLNGPLPLAIDQQDRIWITNAVGDTVTRCPACDPNKVGVRLAHGHC